MPKVLWRNVRKGKRRNLIEELNELVIDELGKAMREVGKALVKSHQLVVADWDSEVDFRTSSHITPDEIWINVFPAGKDSKVWFYVDQGTAPHTIKPKKAKKLSFESGEYIPKTLPSPARTVMGGGVVKGGERIFADIVHHPGSKGRDFTGTIAEDIEPEFKRTIEQAFQRVNRRIQE